MTMIDIETQPTTLPVDLIEQGWRLERKRDNPSFPYRSKNDPTARSPEAYAFAPQTQRKMAGCGPHPYGRWHPAGRVARYDCRCRLQGGNACGRAVSCR